MTDDCELTWAEANVVHGFPLNKPKGYENALSEKPSRADAWRRDELSTDRSAALSMRKRNKPLRRYIYRDPDTGQEFKCWRGEALDRVIRWCGIAQDINKAWWAMSTYREVWRRDVRLRAPLANP